MKIISWNVNGLKSIFKKGFFDFLEKTKPEIVCLQEIKFQTFPEMKIRDYFFLFQLWQEKRFLGSSRFFKKEATES